MLCEKADDRPPGLDDLDVDFRFCAADGLAEAVRGAQALLLWDYFSTAVRDVWADADDTGLDPHHRRRRRHAAVRRTAGAPTWW